MVTVSVCCLAILHHRIQGSCKATTRDQDSTRCQQRGARYPHVSSYTHVAFVLGNLIRQCLWSIQGGERVNILGLPENKNNEDRCRACKSGGRFPSIANPDQEDPHQT